MKTRKGYWVVIAIFFLLLVFILILLGCAPRQPSRFCAGIAGGTDGVSTGWFQYVDYSGDPLNQEGVTMGFFLHGTSRQSFRFGDYVYYPLDPAPQTIEGAGVTGGGGQMTVNGRILSRDWAGHVVFTTAGIGGGQGGSANFVYRTCVPTYQGATANAPYTIGRFTPPRAAALTATELLALSAPTTSPPSSGISLSSDDLLNQQGSCGNGYPLQLNKFMAVNIESEEKYLRYAGPLMYSVIFKTPEAMDLSGQSFGGILKTNAKSINLNIKVVGDNTDKMTHVARTEYFLPVDSSLEISQAESVSVYDRWTPFPDPNIWDPNQYAIDPNTNADPNIPFNPSDPNFFIFRNRLDTSDPNFMLIMIPSRVMTVKVIPLAAEDDALTLNVDMADPNLIIFFSGDWLSDRKLFDLNNDGIVNLRDLP